MKYGRNKRKGISLLLALLMLCSIIAEQARPVAYAADLTELDGAAETEESARLPEDGAFGEDAALEGPSEEPGSEEEQTSEDPSEAIQDEPGDEPSDEAPEDDLTEPEEGEAVLDQPEELPDIEEIAMEERLLGVGPMKVAGNSTITIYFAVPASWTGYDQVKFNAKKGTSDDDPWTNPALVMTNTGETYNGQPIYSVEMTTVPDGTDNNNIPWGGLAIIQFQKFQNGEWKAQEEYKTGSFIPVSTFAGKMYYKDGDQWKWIDYKPDGHDRYANETMAFENKSGETLSEVKYVFYEMDEDGVTLHQVGEVTSLGSVADKEEKTFSIPAENCSYVQFLDAGGNALSPLCNFYGETVGAGAESFTYNRNSMYCYKYMGADAVSVWGEPGGITVYFDATLSKLYYGGKDGTGDYGIPNNSGVIRYYATGSGKSDIEGNMTPVPARTANGHTWSDVYSVDLPEGYTEIAFSSFDMDSITNYGGHGESTTRLTIPADLKSPCFYADTSDKVIYEGGQRNGYWAEVYTIHNAENRTKVSGTGTDIVDINNSETFTFARDTLYVNSTFYDYYTDYELNGYNRDSYGNSNGHSFRNWYTFRQFDQALSDAYRAEGVSIPIYTGHFQPDWDDWTERFSEIANTLNLYGYKTDGVDQKYFMSTNNSTMDVNGSGDKYDFAAQGLVSSTLSGGTVMTSNGEMKLPHFDERFLLGNNSKNAVLGDVYHNVAFPFTKVKDENGVEYWQFDSAQTTLAMRQDPGTGEYYLKNVGNQGWSKNVDSSGTTTGNPVYGFFPFNETSTGNSGSTYNYGFGTKLEFKFRLTEDGTVTGEKDGAIIENVPITFEFSGDDDVWVFIDGQLALDVGGAHGQVDGTLNFQTMQATVSKVKASQGSTKAGSSLTTGFTISGEKENEHTLTMFYMERGMWESNMKVRFNFPDENQLSVEKKVDTSNVNSLFKDVFDDLSLFTFRIQNLATHYGPYSAAQQAVTTQVASVSDGANTLTSGYAGNVFRLASSDWNRDGKGVAYWYAKEEDQSSAYRDLRYGTLTLETPITMAGGSDPGYLDFEFYFDWNDDTPKLNEMYLQLVDTAGKTLGSNTETLAGKTYGTVYLTNKNWVKVRIDLSKLTAESGFNNQVKSIRFGYNYPRNIYLTDFTYIPPVTATANVGFRTKQNDIPDYGSATLGSLQNATDAIYASSTGRTGVVDNEGKFVLAKEETVTFYDQFRRGSYIALSEVLDEQAQKLFSTKWTMYDLEGKAVTAFGSGETVTNPGTIPSMSNVSGTAVDDGRTETIRLDTTGTPQEASGENAYQNRGNASHPENTFVFRSYSEPDNYTTVTKLSVVFTNTVNVGSLTIEKAKAYEADNLDAVYQFAVVFTNVGGLSLESAPIQTQVIELKVGESYTITGIPVGTDYTIHELKPTNDDSKLDSVEQGGAAVAFTNSSVNGSESYAVTGTIAEEANSAVSYTFKNTRKPTVDVSVRKEWKTAENGTLADPPDQIYVKLQRSTDGTNWSDVGSTVTLHPNSYKNETWANYTYTFSELDQYVDYTAQSQVEYQYRVVEVNADGSPLTDSRVTLDGTTFSVSFVNPTRSGDAFAETITNTVVPPPKTTLQITKVDAEDGSIKLQGVQFKLEVLGTGDTWTQVGAIQTTDADGLAAFGELPDGTYRLTETKTANGYNLLSGPIRIRIESGRYWIDSGAEQTITDNTIQLTVTNHKGFTLPQTGGTQPNLVLIGGLALAATGLLIYSFAFYGRKKGARRKRR